MPPKGNDRWLEHYRWLEYYERLRETLLPRAAAGAARADSAAGGEPPPTPHSDLGSRREEDLEDWVPEVPYIEEVMQVLHILRWPGFVQRIDGWTCVVVPVYADVADALEQNLHALGAVAPASEPGAGAGADRGAGAPTRAGAAPPEETHPAVAEDILLDAEEVN